MLGYAGKFLEVDLSKSSFKNTTFPEEWLKDYIGGRALAAKILSERLIQKWENVDPLGPENILVFYAWTFHGVFPRRQNMCNRQIAPKQRYGRLHGWRRIRGRTSMRRVTTA